ncbi:sulfur carrier protein ThiS [Rhizobium sp. RM]|uniref:sulfur carrier protein ThiS n=1 Tax=Rhizobium/Agrobacterium group TaxID=227290 RepID=UPI00110E2085|nr:sulfur carrier protein ThiS [Rhizobium sp. RM]NWJ23394.1 sulfur carrier protein ThiS [Rhizobium sp. RM]TMV14259.1 sulfur carrier protein ThiS [Rhizobium sp. Td3]
MKLLVNGEELDFAADTLAALLADLEYEGEWLATAVNGDLIHSDERAACRLKDRDRIEILSPMQGG